jgi:hypothetical protein
MKKGLFSVGAIVVFAAMSLAQVSSEPAAANPPGTVSVAKTENPVAPADAPASGTLLAVELSKSLDAKKNKANDRIEARTATALLAHGKITVPQNAKIIGHVTEAKARSKTSPDSMVGIIFDRMQLKDGREIPLQLVVQAIARPLQFRSTSETGVSPANRGGIEHAPIGDASTSGTRLPSSYPGDLAPIPDPMAPPASTVVALSPTSRGVVGMKGLSLDSSGPAAVLSSNTGNVHLDSGTQLILLVQ